jgi:hypothetical protein
METIQKEIKHLKVRYGSSQIDKEIYTLTLADFNHQMSEISKELDNGKVIISNLEKSIQNSMETLENISKIWASSDLEAKRILHKTMFPEGIFYNAKNHQYLTREINHFIGLTKSISTVCEEKKKGNFQEISESSLLVSGSRLELPTFGL